MDKFVDPYTRTPSKRARLYAAMRTVRVNRWIKQSGYNISSADKIKIFDNISRHSHEHVLDLAVQALAFVEGIMRANDTLQINMGMSQVRYNIGDSIRQADNVLRIMIIQELLKISNLPNKIKDEILYRVTARILPLRDISQLDLHDHMEQPTRLPTGKTNGKTPPRTQMRRRSLPLARGDTPFF